MKQQLPGPHQCHHLWAEEGTNGLINTVLGCPEGLCEQCTRGCCSYQLSQGRRCTSCLGKGGRQSQVWRESPEEAAGQWTNARGTTLSSSSPWPPEYPEKWPSPRGRGTASVNSVGVLLHSRPAKSHWGIHSSIKPMYSKMNIGYYAGLFNPSLVLPYLEFAINTKDNSLLSLH